MLTRKKKEAYTILLTLMRCSKSDRGNSTTVTKWMLSFSRQGGKQKIWLADSKYFI